MHTSLTQTRRHLATLGGERHVRIFGELPLLELGMDDYFLRGDESNDSRWGRAKPKNDCLGLQLG